MELSFKSFAEELYSFSTEDRAKSSKNLCFNVQIVQLEDSFDDTK